MDDAIKVMGWIIAGAVAIHLLTSTQFPTAIQSITGGFSNIIQAMLGGGTPTASAGGAQQARTLGHTTVG